MPSLGSGFTLADFYRLLQRSALHSIPSIYHTHRLLFIHRDDVFAKTVMAISWERGKALLSTAYHTQPISVSVYRALLARMVSHNRCVLQLCRGVEWMSPPASAALQARAGEDASTLRLVPWREALSVYREAMTTHGIHCPTRMTVSALRLLAPEGRTTWTTALSVLKMEQLNGRLTKSMVLETARVCAVGRKWETALALLHHVHQQDPFYLSAAIQSLRPPGTNLFTMEEAAHATLPSSLMGTATHATPTRTLRHRLGILAEVMSVLPPEVAQGLPVWQSFTSHLVASTTLPVALKARWLTMTLSPLQWNATVHLLQQYIGDNEWTSTIPDKLTEGKEWKGKRKRGKRERRDRITGGQGVPQLKASHDGETRKEISPVGEEGVDSSLSFRLPLDLLYSLQDAPRTLSVLIAVLLNKCPTTPAAVAFAQQLRRHGTDPSHLGEDCTPHSQLNGEKHNGNEKQSGTSLRREEGKSSGEREKRSMENAALSSFGKEGKGIREATHTSEIIPQDKLSYALQQPVVREMLLQKCIAPSSFSSALRSKENRAPQARGSADGWRTAVQLVLNESFLPTPPALLSQLVHQLRTAKQVTLLIRLLQEHIIPSQSTLEPWAMTMMMEAVLAYNQFTRGVHTPMPTGHSSKGASIILPLPRVEWLTALSVLMDRQVSVYERGMKSSSDRATSATQGRLPPTPIVSSLSFSTSSSLTRNTTAEGAPSEPEKVKETPLTSAQLRLAIAISVESSSCLGAIRMIGYAKRSNNKDHLPLSKEVTALLYCMHYQRPREAVATLQKAEEKYGKRAVAPLRQMLALYPPWNAMNKKKFL